MYESPSYLGKNFGKILVYSVILGSLLYNPVKLSHSELIDVSPLERIVER